MASKVFIHFAVLSMAAANKYNFKMREIYDDIEQSDEACVLSGRSSYKPPPPAIYKESTGDKRHPRDNRTWESRGHHHKNISYELKRFGNFRRDGDSGAPAGSAKSKGQTGAVGQAGAAKNAPTPATTPLPYCTGLLETAQKNKCQTITDDYKEPTGEGTPPGPLNSIRGTTSKKLWTTKIFKLTRTTPFRLSFNVECDYLAYYCMKAYQTGRLCARTFYYIYHTFINYCMLDYVNCREKHEVWQVIHMGDCFVVVPLTSYNQYPYHNDYFLDQYYIQDENTLLFT